MPIQCRRKGTNHTKLIGDLLDPFHSTTRFLAMFSTITPRFILLGFVVGVGMACSGTKWFFQDGFDPFDLSHDEAIASARGGMSESE